MSRLEQLRVSGQMIFLAVAGAAMVAPVADVRARGYLTVIGPPDLRFATASPQENFTPTRFLPVETNLTAIESSPVENAAGVTNNFSIPTNAAPAAAVMMSAGATPPTASLPALNFSSGGTDPSVITAAMLADFLKPSGPGKIGRDNNASPAVVVPVNVGFTPPATVPENTSRAVYKTE